MQFLKSVWPKAVVFLLVISVAFYFYHGTSGDNGPRSDVNSEIEPQDDYDQFYMDKLSLLKREGGKTVFSLSADKVFKRKRVARFFVYQNLKEICMSGVKIDVYPGDKKAFTKKILLRYRSRI